MNDARAAWLANTYTQRLVKDLELQEKAALAELEKYAAASSDPLVVKAYAEMASIRRMKGSIR